MLILNRKAGESIILDDNIEIKILEVQDGRVKVGIEAPSDVTILRCEVYEEVMEENKKSADLDKGKDILDLIRDFRR